jgi:hypothetical protein
MSETDNVTADDVKLPPAVSAVYVVLEPNQLS